MKTIEKMYARCNLKIVSIITKDPTYILIKFTSNQTEKK